MQQNMMEQNIIITEPSSNLRTLGRNALSGKWQVSIVALIIYGLCLQIPQVVLDSIFGVNVLDVYNNAAGSYNGVSSDIATSSLYEGVPEYSVLSGIYAILVTGAFALGITMFFLAMFRRQQVGSGDIFLGFGFYGKALGLSLFQALFIFLWSLLFIVPGIIAAIRYSQAFFVMADNPDKGIRECMNESKRMMRGNKAKYFCLILSFIGWAILAGLVIGVVDSVIDILGVPTILNAIITVIVGLVMTPLTAYIYSTQAGFYEILAGHLIKETEPTPIAPEAITSPAESLAAPDESETKSTGDGSSENETRDDQNQQQ